MVIQHMEHEPLGTLTPLLEAAGFSIQNVNFYRNPESGPQIAGCDGLIVLGGPMGVYEADQFPHLKVEMAVIESALKKDIPILGICLGAQLLAHVLGGRVFKGPQMELGWLDLQVTNEGRKDPLINHYQATEKIFQLHQDTFTLPSGAHHLARSPLFESQAFRYGQKAYGFQFHLEIDQPMVERWLKVPGNKQLIANSAGLYSAETISRETIQFIPRSLTLAEQTFAKFIELL